jgi:hypothetical protein
MGAVYEKNLMVLEAAARASSSLQYASTWYIPPTLEVVIVRVGFGGGVDHRSLPSGLTNDGWLESVDITKYYCCIGKYRRQRPCLSSLLQNNVIVDSRHSAARFIPCSQEVRTSAPHRRPPSYISHNPHQHLRAAHNTTTMPS